MHPVVFLHLPKTAGSTLNAVLQRQFRPQETHWLVSAGGKLDENIAAFKNLPWEKRHAIRLLGGHQPFGLHEYLAPGARYVTALREPVQRVISHFHFARRRKHPKFPEASAEGMTVDQYFADGISGELENGQTRWLAGIWDERPLTAADFERAMANVEQHFDWLGIMEHFDASLVDLGLQYGWPRLYYRKKNARGSGEGSAASARTLEIIAGHNRYDIEIYKYALQRFEAHSLAYKGLRSGGGALLNLANRAGSALRPG